MIRYKQEDENQLLNDFGCYIPDSLHTFQNMQEFSRDIDEYVSHSTTLEDGTVIYSLSKELLAYVQACVAFSQYYRADVPRAPSVFVSSSKALVR